MALKPYKTYLFDFDGTLVDSMPTYTSAMLRILDENQIAYGDDVIKIITPLGVAGTAEYFRSIGLKMETQELKDRMGFYMVDAYKNHIPAKEYVADVLKKMKSLGYSLNVLTASPHRSLDPCLKRLELWELFDNVWSSDDFATTKADPDIYRQAAQRLGTSVDAVLFLDDNIHAIETAKAAGMGTCGVFDPSSQDAVEQMQQVADGYIFDFSQLLA